MTLDQIRYLPTPTSLPNLTTDQIRALIGMAHFELGLEVRQAEEAHEKRSRYDRTPDRRDLLKTLCFEQCEPALMYLNEQDRGVFEIGESWISLGGAHPKQRPALEGLANLGLIHRNNGRRSSLGVGPRSSDGKEAKYPHLGYELSEAGAHLAMQMLCVSALFRGLRYVFGRAAQAKRERLAQEVRANTLGDTACDQWDWKPTKYEASLDGAKGESCA